MLVKLSNTNLRLADPGQDIRGHRVVDKDGHKVGEVDDLILDALERKVRFLQVASGDLFGFGPALTLIPVEAVTEIDEAEVHINQTRQRVAAAPRYDPAFVQQVLEDQGGVAGIYHHYGFLPFWGRGYIYPPESRKR
jgi:sporulation protein YlmC with PRC-barrel domain